MTPRLNPLGSAPDGYKAMVNLETYVKNCGLEYGLLHLVKMRVSQINGCAFCLDMHSKDARKAGESEARLYLLNAWRESPLYSDRERAALGWAEALTLVAETAAPDADYAALKQQFTEKEIVDLSLAIGAINVWNRLAIGFRLVHPVVDADKAAAA